MRPFDTRGAFVPFIPGGGSELRHVAVRGAGVTVVSGGVALAIQIVATVVLARLLTPTDFGLVAMVTTFSLLLVNFGFNGLTEAIIQREDIDQALASTLFWINLVAGLFLTIGFAASGSLLAKFYHNAPVRQVTAGIALTIFATSVSVVHSALLKRAMYFYELSVIDICARMVSVAVSILLGWAGWGYWALVAGAVALPLSSSIGTLALCRWVPGLPRRVEGTGSALRFAINTYGNFGVNYLSRNTDNMLVGWRFDAQALGFYKKAYDLFALSAGQLVSSTAVVVVAALSRVRRDSDQYRRYLLGAIGVMAFVGMGLAAALTLVGKDLIRVMLGPKWEPAGYIFSFFGPGIGAMILYGTHGWIHLSIGRADRWFRWAILEFIVTCLLFVAALPWGPAGVAVAWTVSLWILTIPAIWYAGRPIGFGIGPVLAIIYKYTVAAILAGFATWGAIRQFPFLAAVPGAAGAAVRILSVSSLFGGLYLGGVILFHGGLEPLYRIARLLRELAPSPKFAAPEQIPATPLAAGPELDRRGQTPVGGESIPLVSILIPAHNAEEWIADTIRSAMAQTWPRLEIVVVDDGSTDRTLAIAQQFQSQQVHVVRQENQGASAARNKAFSLSHGDYIQWLDADDLLAPDKIAMQMLAIEKGIGNRTLLSSAWGYFMYRANRARFIPTVLWCDLSPVEWLLRKMRHNVFMQTATWLVSRELTEAAGPWDVRLLGDDDGEYFCRVLLASDGVHFVPDAKVYYRAFRFSSLSYIGRFPKKIEAHWLSMQLHIRYLRSLEDSERVRAACLAYLRDSMIYFYPERNDIVRHAEQIAVELGCEEVGAPHLPWKYSWIEALFGWKAAKPVQRSLRKFRWSMERLLDKMLFWVEKHYYAPISQDQPKRDLVNRLTENTEAQRATVSGS